jgi:hypothetical protein
LNKLKPKFPTGKIKKLANRQTNNFAENTFETKWERDAFYPADSERLWNCPDSTTENHQNINNTITE